MVLETVGFLIEDQYPPDCMFEIMLLTVSIATITFDSYSMETIIVFGSPKHRTRIPIMPLIKDFSLHAEPRCQA